MWTTHWSSKSHCDLQAVKQAAVEVSQQANVQVGPCSSRGGVSQGLQASKVDRWHLPAQVHSAVEEAWHTASSLQKKVASVLHNGAGESDRDLCMGVRAGPRPTVAPAYVRALQTGKSNKSLVACCTTIQAPVAALYANPDLREQSTVVAGLGWTALATAGVVLLWLLAKVPGLLVARLGGRAQGGRWVRDRSLGGKLVREWVRLHQAG